MALLSGNSGITNGGGSATRTSPDLNNDPQDDFGQNAKKVELPLFNDEDPAGWIVRAKMYFQVHETHPHIKVKLAQLYMEGSTIHFFKSLIDENTILTWEQ